MFDLGDNDSTIRYFNKTVSEATDFTKNGTNSYLVGKTGISFFLSKDDFGTYWCGFEGIPFTVK